MVGGDAVDVSCVRGAKTRGPLSTVSTVDTLPQKGRCRWPTSNVHILDIMARHVQQRCVRGYKCVCSPSRTFTFKGSLKSSQPCTQIFPRIAFIRYATNKLNACSAQELRLDFGATTFLRFFNPRANLKKWVKRRDERLGTQIASLPHLNLHSSTKKDALQMA